jgi:hypothetical protein
MGAPALVLVARTSTTAQQRNARPQLNRHRYTGQVMCVTLRTKSAVSIDRNHFGQLAKDHGAPSCAAGGEAVPSITGSLRLVAERVADPLYRAAVCERSATVRTGPPGKGAVRVSTRCDGVLAVDSEPADHGSGWTGSPTPPSAPRAPARRLLREPAIVGPFLCDYLPHREPTRLTCET